MSWKNRKTQLFSLVLGVVIISGQACPKTGDAQSSGDAAASLADSTSVTTVGQTGLPNAQQQDQSCEVGQLLPSFVNDQAGRSVGSLQEIFRQVQCVSDLKNLSLTVNTGAGHDLIRVACQEWSNCYSEDGKKLGSDCTNEQADVVYNVTSQVPPCVRRASNVRAYRRSSEIPALDSTVDNIRSLMYMEGGHVVFSSEFFPKDSRVPGRFDMSKVSDQTRFARDAEARFEFKQAEAMCQWESDFDSSIDATRVPPPVRPDFAQAVSRGRALLHEYVHGVLDAHGDDAVSQFADKTPAWGHLTSSFDSLAAEGVMPATKAQSFTERFGVHVQTVIDLRLEITAVGGDDTTRLMDTVNYSLRRVANSRVATPELVQHILEAEIALRTREQQMAVRKGDRVGWTQAREKYCASVRELGELLNGIGFASRWGNDPHSVENKEEAFTIAVTMAVVDPAGFRSKYSKAQQDVVSSWWNRTMDCTLEEARQAYRLAS